MPTANRLSSVSVSDPQRRASAAPQPNGPGSDVSDSSESPAFRFRGLGAVALRCLAHRGGTPFGYLGRMTHNGPQVRDVMTKEIIALSPDQHLRAVDDLMKIAGIRHIPVVKEGRLVGIVSQRDLYQAALSSVLQFPASAARGWLEHIAVAEVMTRQVVTAAPDWPIGRAVDAMLEHAIGSLPVVEGDTLIGLVTETTFLRLLGRMISGGVVSGRVP